MSAPPVGPPLLRAATWPAHAQLRHGFFGRRGGTSAGPLASLNVSASVGDAPTAVAANWRRIAAALPDLAIARMRQVHGARVAQVTVAGADAGEADAMVTDADGVGLAVLTADCVPILAVAPAARAVLAVHAGWRGTAAGVTAAAIDAAHRWYGIEAAEWHVALGPSIGGCCYEVDAAIGDRMVAQWGAMPDAWQPAGARGQLDLRAVNRRVLEACGVAADRIELVGPCTSCAADGFFSHRRSGGRAGRQASIVGWVDSPPP